MFFAAPKPKIICVGSTTKDIFFPTDEGGVIETPQDLLSKEKIAFELGAKFLVAKRYEAVGGVAANTAHGLTRLGHPAACYSKIGNDEVGDWILAQFKSSHVPTTGFFVDSLVQTDLSAIIVLISNGERIIFHNRDASNKLDIIEEKLKASEWVHVSALNGDWQKNIREILDLKKKFGFSLVCNPGQHNIKENSTQVMNMVSQSDVLILNKDEALELVMSMKKNVPQEHLDNEMFLLETLHRAGAKTIGMTDGKRGAWSFDGKEHWYCPIATRSSVVDTTGAGDAFGSGFFAALLEGCSLEESLRYGIANSGSVVGEYGAIKGLLSQEEMKQSIENIVAERLN
jgi:sugar/nucleoside kinase (ribokinase family)